MIACTKKGVTYWASERPLNPRPGPDPRDPAAPGLGRAPRRRSQDRARLRQAAARQARRRGRPPGADRQRARGRLPHAPAGRADVGLACLRPCVTPGTRTRVSPGCCDGAEAERVPARRTSPITIPPAPAHRLVAQRRRVRSVSAAPRRQSLAWVVAWRASASQASAAARWSVAVICAASATCAARASFARTMAARRAVQMLCRPRTQFFRWRCHPQGRSAV